MTHDWNDTLARLDAQHLRRHFRARSSGGGVHVVKDGRTLLNFASHDVLGLSTDPRVMQAAREAILLWGVGSGGSPLVSGWTRLHEDLTGELAAFLECESVLLFSSGYAASVGVLTALAGPGDAIFADARAHSALIDAFHASHARTRHYRHGDIGHLAELLADEQVEGQRFVVSDGVFGPDAELADVRALADAADRFGAMLVLHDGHGFGVLGPDGRGTASHAGVAGRVPVTIGSLGKALGAQGGFVAGGRVLCDVIANRARALLHSTALAPPLVAASLAALRVARAEPGRRASLHGHLQRLREGLAEQGLRVVGHVAAPSLGVHTGTAEAALALTAHLEAAGVLAAAVRPPTVEEGACRVRLTPSATHTDVDIDDALLAFVTATSAS